jgi:hypothetical protein
MTHPRDLDTYAHRLHRAHATVPHVLDHLDEQRALLPTLRAAAYDDTSSSSSEHPDPVALIVAELDRLEHYRGDIYDAIATLGVCIDMLDKRCRAALSARANIDANEPEPEWRPTEERLCIGWAGMPAEQSCASLPTPRTDHTTRGTIDDGRCVQCGPLHDGYERAKAEQRAKDAQRKRTARLVS